MTKERHLKLVVNNRSAPRPKPEEIMQAIIPACAVDFMIRVMAMTLNDMELNGRTKEELVLCETFSGENNRRDEEVCQMKDCSIRVCDKKVDAPDTFNAMRCGMLKIDEEYGEIRKDWLAYKEGNKNPKMFQQLGEEIVDLMTACATMLYTMDKQPVAPNGFAQDCLTMVSAKNYARGYWDD